MVATGSWQISLILSGRGFSRLSTTRRRATSSRVHLIVFGWSLTVFPMVSPKYVRPSWENKCPRTPLRSTHKGIAVRYGFDASVSGVHSWTTRGTSAMCQKWHFKTLIRICLSSKRKRTFFGFMNCASIFAGFSLEVQSRFIVAWTFVMCGASEIKCPTR